jgi:hypothetical protein
MASDARGWQLFDAQTPVLTYLYSFGPGSAHALAAGGRDGLVIVSPPSRARDDVFDDIGRYGPVRALVASNAFHYMGIPQWKERFPDAPVFAPAQSIARVQRQTGLTGIRPLADAASITGPRLALVDMPHYKTGEAMVRIETPRGLVWYLTDVVLNLPVLPSHPVIRMMFKLSGSAPGLKINNIAPLFMVKDKAALKRWLAAELQKWPPRWLIPAHGDIVDLGPEPAALQGLFAPR